MIQDFYLAHVPEPTTILGLELRPLSLGHLILLNRVESAFAVGGTPGYDDLAISVFICSRSYADSIAAFNDPMLSDFMRKWHDKLTGADCWLVRLGLRQPQLIDLRKKCAEFAEYIKTHNQFPKYTYTPGDFGTLEVPLEQIVKVALMRDMKFPESEILDRSWWICMWDFLTLRAMTNQVRIYHEDFESGIKEAQDYAEQLAIAVREGKLRVN